MNISIIGPEGSGKTTLAVKTIIKQVGFKRPVFYLGKLKTEFQTISIKEWHTKRDAVILIDDANAVIESIDVYNKDLHLKEPLIMHRHYNLLNIGIFHSMDDAVKFFFRQSRYVYVSKQYRDQSFQKNKFISGIMPETIGRGKFLFDRYKRY